MKKLNLAGYLFASLFLFFFSVSTVSASTTILFSDTFENGLNGWTGEGTASAEPSLWHLSERRSASSSHSWYYGLEDTGTYNTNYRNYGVLKSPILAVPGGVNSLNLRWDQFLDTENIATSSGVIVYDKATVEVSNDDGLTWNLLGTFRSTANNWTGVFTSIPSYYMGPFVQLRFVFDTVDHIFNDYEGWYVDNFEVSAIQNDPTPTPAPVCNLPAEVSLMATQVPQIFPGQAVNNEFVIKNPNEAVCGPVLYGISRSYPAGWSLEAPYSVSVGGGETKSVSFVVTASSGSPAGTYDYSLYANGGYGAKGYVQLIQDEVVITKANFVNSRKQLVIEATSTSNGLAALNAVGIGPLTYDTVAKIYRITTDSSYLSNVTVQSAFGGTSTSPVSKVAK